MEVSENAIRSVAMGAAKPTTVIEHWMGVLAEFPELVHDLQSIKALIEGMTQDDSGTRILKSIACAILNQDYVQTGIICLVDEDNYFGIKFDEKEEFRKVVFTGLLDR